MRHRALTALAMLVSCLMLASCGLLDEGGLESRDVQPGATPVNVGYLHTVGVDDKLSLGMLKGHFADQGLDIRATEFDTGIAVSQALVSGDIDVAIMGGVTSNFPARGQGTIFMANSIEHATARLYVQGDSGIETVEDLAGKTLATTEGTTADVYLHSALRKAGLDRDDLKIVNASMPNALQAFVSGSVDAVALWVPYDLRLAEGDPEAKQIDNAGNYPDAKVVDGWIANNDWYAQNRDVAKRIVRGWLETNEEFRANPDAALEILVEEAYAGQATLADLEHQLRFQQDFTNEEWLRMYESGEVLDIVGEAERAFVDLGGVPKYVDPEEFFDTSLFIETAEETLQ